MTRPQNTRLPAGEAASRRGRVSFGALLDLSIAMLVALAGCFLLARNTGQADTLIRVGDHQVGILVDDLGDRDGELVATLGPGATNLVTGRWRESGLGQVFRLGLEQPGSAGAVLVDFAGRRFYFFFIE